MQRFFFLFLVVISPFSCSSEKAVKVKYDTKVEVNKKIEEASQSILETQVEGELSAIIHTDEGDLSCRLFETRAPKTVRNFVELGLGKKEWEDPKTHKIVKNTPFYKNIIFHRIIPGFFLQTGDPLGTGEGGPGFIFDDEIHPELKHDRAGILSMANHGPNTNGSQFFILLKPAPHLEGHHSVFGACEPQNIINKLASYPTDANNRPTDPPKIKSIEFKRIPIHFKSLKPVK